MSKKRIKETESLLSNEHERTTLTEKEFLAKKELLIKFFNDKAYKPMKFKEIAGILQVEKPERVYLRQILDALVKENIITTDATGRYIKPDSNILTGVFCGTNRGFGFVKIESEDEDIYIPESETKNALDKDIVKVVIAAKETGRKKEGKIIEILERSNNEVVGIFQENKNYGFVISDNHKLGRDIFIPKEYTKGAVRGHKVVAEITDYGDKNRNPEGRIKEILGHINDPGVDIMSIIKANGIDIEFPTEVMREIENIPDEIDKEDIKGRLDIRNLQTVTIDGEDAKDLDDAITLTKEGDIYKLGVHIADVSNYVREGSELDKEALKRATSVYLVDRVIPMLPHKLSNGICSLNQGTDRLALSCIMDIDKKGNVIGHIISETVINVDKRMSYTEVRKIIEDKDEETISKYEQLVPMFFLMDELAVILRDKRKQRGSIDFDFPESKITLDSNGKAIDVKPYERNRATKLIEDFMLIANETVAEDYFWQEIPFVYRCHDNPDPEKIKSLGIFINNFGYTMHIGSDEIHPKELQKLLKSIEGTDEEMLISRLTLRSMKRAVYSAECNGHFGLAAKYYCHFTSPIRRYPDLQIHRIIKENLKGGIKEARINHYTAILNDVAMQSSRMERRADDAEREVEKLKKVEYMSNYIGKTFEGVISSVTSWGIYVELPNTVEGMIRIENLFDDDYIFDEERYIVIGKHTKRTYKLGQKLKVIVADTNKTLRTIDFVPVMG